MDRWGRVYAFLRSSNTNALWLHRWSNSIREWVADRAANEYERFGVCDSLPADQAALYGVRHDMSVFDQIPGDPQKCAHCKDTGLEPDLGDDMTPEVPCEKCEYDERYSRFYEMKP